MTDPVDAFIAQTLANQINNYDWADANTTHGLLATIDPAHANQIVITAAQYGTVNATNNTVEWGSGTKFSGVAPGTTFLIGGTPYEVASVQSPKQLTLTLPVGASGRRVLSRPPRRARRQHDHSLLACQFAVDSRFRPVSRSARRRQFIRHVELLARLHGARNRPAPPVLADVCTLACQRSRLHRVGMARHLLELEPHRPDRIRCPHYRSPGPAAFASSRITPPARSIANGPSRPGHTPATSRRFRMFPATPSPSPTPASSRTTSTSGPRSMAPPRQPRG